MILCLELKKLFLKIGLVLLKRGKIILMILEIEVILSENPDKAFESWYKDIEIKYKKHTNRLNLEKHPKYIQNKIENLSDNQFGYSAFGLKENTKRSLEDFLKGKKRLHLDKFKNNINLNRTVFK